MEAPRPEARKERRPDLEPNEEDEEHQPEIAQEAENRRVGREAEVPGRKPREEDEGDAQRHPEDAQPPQRGSDGDDERVDEKVACEGGWVGERAERVEHESCGGPGGNGRARSESV